MQTRADRDSQLGGARLLGSSTRDSLRQKTDLDDLYRFSVSGRSRVDVELSGLARRTNADIELYRLTRPFNDAVRSIGKISFRKLRGNQRNANLQFIGASRRGRNSNELISAELDSGDYIVRVLQRQGNPRYQLRLSNTPVLLPEVPPVPPAPPEVPPEVPPAPPAPPEVPPVPPAPPGPPAPIPLTVPTTSPVVGSVSDAAQDTTYSFSVGADSDYLFNLSGLTGDADLQILAADRTTLVKTSANLGANPEQFIQPLLAGNYFVRVFQKAPGVNANYQLTVNPLTDNVSNAQSTATAIAGLSGSTLTRRNYVGAGSRSPVDYYEFTTPNTGNHFLTVEMIDLFDDLDVELYEKPADPSAVPDPRDIAPSNKPGTAAETFGGTLGGGKTFILKILPGAEATSGSTYRLNLRLSPTQSRPSVTRDIAFGSSGSGASNLTSVGSFAYFTANDGTGNALWVSDGTLDGTRRLGKFNTIGEFSSVNGTLYFTADNGTSGLELWRSDGTAAGTRIVVDKLPGINSFNPNQFTLVNNRLYFFGQPQAAAGSKGLFYLDALDTSSDPIKAVVDATNNAAFNPLSFNNLTAVGNTLYFTGIEGANATSKGIELLRIQNASTSTTIDTIDVNNNNNTLPNGSSNPRFLTAVGNTLFFQARAPLNGEEQTELFRLNANGSITAFDLPPEPRNSNPANLFEMNGTLYFAANGGDGTNEFGVELWALKDAETATGTDSQVPVRVKDINLGAGSSSPSNFVNLNGTLYFIADDGTDESLWRTVVNQTDESITAEKVSAVNNKLSGVTDLSNLTVVGQGADARLYFVATKAGDTEVWFTDGTVAGTGFFDVNDTTSSNPEQLTDINGRLFFIASTPDRGAELWSFSGVPVSS
jgi:ELWxxDGT repeat protein